MSVTLALSTGPSQWLIQCLAENRLVDPESDNNVFAQYNYFITTCLLDVFLFKSISSRENSFVANVDIYNANVAWHDVMGQLAEPERVGLLERILESKLFHHYQGPYTVVDGAHRLHVSFTLFKSTTMSLL